MLEITIQGRGGQGGVTLAKLIATAYFLRGQFSQAFGVYAAERSGAPVQAYVRIDDQAITNTNQIREPDHLIVLDPTLIAPAIAIGADPGGWLILNTPNDPAHWAETFAGRRVATIDATAIAVRHGLGTRAVPIVNTTMLGAVARVFGLSEPEVEAALADLGFEGPNLDAAREAFRSVATEQLGGSAAAVIPIQPPQKIPSLFDEDLGGPPRIRTGSWATRRPQRRTLTPPCNHSCPAGNDVQGFIDAIAKETIDDALAILLETSPLPGVCGRVCPAPCMQSCNRAGFDEGINVRELERHVADRATWPDVIPPHRLQRIAVVGSGPAGLSATYHLARLGYQVSIFEADDALGGVLRNGIPDYRLPREVLDRELGFILMHGVTAYTDAPIDRRALLELTEHYSAVFVATGLQSSRSMHLGNGGEQPADIIHQGIAFLDGVHRGAVSMKGKRVAVVGGGNTAIDAARSALRLGASDVRILYRRSRAEMPAIADEIDAALEEGVKLDELTLPLKLERVAGGAELHCARVILGEPDESGRRRPVPSPTDRFIVACDEVVLALGQEPDLSILREGAEIHQDGRLLGVASAPVFLGGDFATNSGTVAAAIGSGRRAAVHIHYALDDSGEEKKRSSRRLRLTRANEMPAPQAEEPRVATRDDLRLALFNPAARRRGRAMPPEERRHSFAEVHFGLEDDARSEAQRCFSCGVCNDCERCITCCPEGVLTRETGGYLFNYDYCKGCGICASQCARGVVVMSEL